MEWTDYLFAAEEIGTRVEHSVSGVYTRYFQKDHLNSIAVITDEAGSVVEQLSYDAWGKRRHAAKGPKLLGSRDMGVITAVAVLFG